jgi:hypothetical protein
MNQENLSKLINSTQIFAEQCKDKDGKSIFEGKVNPFTLLGQLTNLDSAEASEEQCMKQYNSLLKNLGLDNVDLNNINLSDITQQLHSASNLSKNKGRTKRKVKKKK